MATYYWIGDSGSYLDWQHWSASSGGAPIGPGSRPGISTDALIFDHNSFTVDGGVISDTGIWAAGLLDCSDLAHTVTVTDAGCVGGTVILSPFLTIRYSLDLRGTLTLNANGAILDCDILLNYWGGGAKKTITLTGDLIQVGNHISFGSYNVLYIGGDYYYPSPVDLVTNGFNIEADFFQLSDHSDLHLGSSIITCYERFTVGADNIIDAGTSTIYFPRNDWMFWGGNYAYYDLVADFSQWNPAWVQYYPDVGYIAGNATFHNLTATTANKVSFLRFYGSPEITNLLTFTGVDANNRLMVYGDDTYEPTLIAAAVSLSNVDFCRVNGAGAAAPFTGTSIGDVGGNTGITFDAPVVRYWIGGPGSWSDTAHWSTSSGGAGGETVPLIQDSVFIDDNSISAPLDQIILNNPRLCTDLTVSAGMINTPLLSFWDFGVWLTTWNGYGHYGYPTSYIIRGNLSINTYSVIQPTNSNLELMGDGVQEIKTTGTIMNIGIICFNEGTYKLKDTYAGYCIKVLGGSFETQGYDISTRVAQLVYQMPVPSIKLGDTHWTITGDGTDIDNQEVWRETLAVGAFDAGTSKISIVSPSAGVKEFSAEWTSDYYDVEFNTPYVYLSGQFQSCRVFKIYAGVSMDVTSESEWIMQSFIAKGTSRRPITIRSDWTPDQYTFNAASGTFYGYFLDLKDCIATGGAAFHACRSTDSGGNSGWIWDCPLHEYYMLEGDPTGTGIYTLGRFSQQYPYILDMTYPISERDGSDLVLDGVEIGALLIDGQDIYASWKRTALDGAVTYGVDKLDANNKLSGAFIETRVLSGNREQFGNFSKFIWSYAEMPTGTNLTLKYTKNYGADWIDMTTIKDTDRKILYCEKEVEATTLALRVIVVASGNDAPSIERGDIVLR